MNPRLRRLKEQADKRWVGRTPRAPCWSASAAKCLKSQRRKTTVVRSPKEQSSPTTKIRFYVTFKFIFHVSRYHPESEGRITARGSHIEAFLTGLRSFYPQNVKRKKFRFLEMFRVDDVSFSLVEVTGFKLGVNFVTEHDGV